MQVFFRCALLLGIALAVSALPSHQRRQEVVEGAGKFQWQIYKACPDANRDAIKRAWGDSSRLGQALASWVPKGAYQPAMDMYMGDRSTYETVGDPGYNFPQQIQDTTRRYNGLFDGKSEYGTANLWVYCNEDSFWFGHCKSNVGAVIAYETEDAFFNNWYITFCPAFYDSDYQVPLDDVFTKIRNLDLDPTIMENYIPDSQAATFFHESMHMSQLVTSPKAYDSAYGPKLVYELARSSNTDRAVYNADSWTWAAFAILAQQEFDLPEPPRPVDYAGEGATAYDGNATVLENIEVQTDGNFVPEGAGEQASDSPFYVDESIWEIVVGESEVTSHTDCHGVSGDYWIESRDVAIESVNDFCDQTEGTKVYNEGTANELELFVALHDEEQSPADAPDCVQRFTNSIDNCDGNDPTANPNNYKFGSTMSVSDGWSYRTTAKAKQVDDDDDDDDGGDGGDGGDGDDDGDDEEVDPPEEDPPSLPSCPGCDIN